MFRFQEFYTDPNQSPSRRVDVCSGPFKHISADIITESLCLLRNSIGQVLVVHNSDSNSWILPGGDVTSGQSPKQTMVEFLKQIGMTFQNPEHLAFQKTLNPIEDEIDSNGNQAWEVNSVQVLWTAQININSTFVTHSSFDQVDWVEIEQLPKLLKSIYGSAKVLGLVMELIR